MGNSIHLFPDDAVLEIISFMADALAVVRLQSVNTTLNSNVDNWLRRQTKLQLNKYSNTSKDRLKSLHFFLEVFPDQDKYNGVNQITIVDNAEENLWGSTTNIPMIIEKFDDDGNEMQPQIPLGRFAVTFDLKFDHNYEGFAINFQPTLPANTILYHYNPRTRDSVNNPRVTVHNTHYNWWGPEERNPNLYDDGKKYCTTFLLLENQFRVVVDTVNEEEGRLERQIETDYQFRHAIAYNHTQKLETIAMGGSGVHLENLAYHYFPRKEHNMDPLTLVNYSHVHRNLKVIPKQ